MCYVGLTETPEDKRRIYMLKVLKVENPKYQTMNEIAKDFWNNWLIIANRTENPIGGVVLYYCENRIKALTDILAELDQDPEGNGYPDFTYVGPSRGSLGGVCV
jgi:hypothetical protein